MANAAPEGRRRRPSPGNRLVVASWGGQFGEEQRKAHFEPFARETGIEVIVAPQQPEVALIEAQVASGAVTIDVSNHTSNATNLMADKGLLDPIRYDWMDPRIIGGADPVVRGSHGVGLYTWSFNLSYSGDWFGGSAAPRTWADYWDVDRFPGPRGFQGLDYDPPLIEVILLANGVPPDKLYPIDIDEAFRLLTDFRANVEVWTGYGADTTTLLNNGEIAVGQAGADTIQLAVEDGADVGFSWQQALLYTDNWVIPKGARNIENAHRFIEFCLRPEVQADFTRRVYLGAVVPAAYDLVPADIQRRAVTAPEHLEKAVPVNVAFWSQKGGDGKSNLEAVFTKWADWILK